MENNEEKNMSDLRYRLVSGATSGAVFAVILVAMDYMFEGKIHSITSYVIQGLAFGVIMSFVYAAKRKKRMKELEE